VVSRGLAWERETEEERGGEALGFDLFLIWCALQQKENSRLQNINQTKKNAQKNNKTKTETHT
jgi:hypothetical protein